MLSGLGTLLTGASSSTRASYPRAAIAIGSSFNAESRDGFVREIEEGDIVVIPAGLMHTWTLIPDHVTYLSVRIDPDQVLPDRLGESRDQLTEAGSP
jgi:hypothetical protein